MDRQTDTRPSATVHAAPTTRADIARAQHDAACADYLFALFNGAEIVRTRALAEEVYRTSWNLRCAQGAALSFLSGRIEGGATPPCLDRVSG